MGLSMGAPDLRHLFIYERLIGSSLLATWHGCCNKVVSSGALILCCMHSHASQAWPPFPPFIQAFTQALCVGRFVRGYRAFFFLCTATGGFHSHLPVDGWEWLQASLSGRPSSNVLVQLGFR